MTDQNTRQDLTNEEKKVFEQLDAQLQDFGNNKAMADIGDLCPQYHKVKPILQMALPIIRKFIPVYGEKVAKAIEFLMSIADTVCPVD